MEVFLEKEEEEGAIPSEGQEVPLASHFLTIIQQTVISPQKNTFFGWHFAKEEKDENGQKITHFSSGNAN